MALPWFVSSWAQYRRLAGAERTSLLDSHPQLHDRTAVTPFDAHYFFMNAWAMRCILRSKPKRHVDVGSHNAFVSLLSAAVPVAFLDYRPLTVELDGLVPICGSVTELPFGNQTLASISSLSVVEHIGLGRYGDTLDCAGTMKSAAELTRVLAPGGNLFVGVPIGAPRVCFNAHRILAPDTFVDLFRPLKLVQFSVVTDEGLFHENVEPAEYSTSRYSCGLYWLTRDLDAL
jgi:hypothetical protein